MRRKKDQVINPELLRAVLLGLLLAITCIGQAPTTRAELGSRTAKEGFKNETEIAGKFNNWETDADAREWLKAMNYELAEIDSVAATKPHGEKADIQVGIKTKAGEFTEGISIKLVSSPQGFNQIDKRWLATYAKMWRMPANVVRALEFFLGEVKPYKASRNEDRMFLDELDTGVQRMIIDFFAANAETVVSDIFEGDGQFAAKWFMVALKSANKPKWIMVSSAYAAKFFSEGSVEITRNGNLKIGRITMQRKGGDGGRETARMLQFKINPVELFEKR